jgi:hypothetical protein
MMPEFLEFEDEAGPSVAGDMAAAAPRGLAKGVVGMAGLPGDMLSAANKAGDWVNQKLGVPGPKGAPGETSNPFVPTSAQLQSTIEELTGAWGEAKTKPGKYVESVTSMLPAAFTGGEGLAAKGLTALGGGIGAQAGEDVAGTPGRIAGGLLGGGIGGAASAARTVRPDFEETFSTFQRLGLTPTAATTDVGGKTTKFLEANVLPQAIGSANRMQKTIEGNLAQFTRKQQEIAASFGAPKPKYDTGHEAQEAILTGWEGRKEEAGRIFDAIGKAFGPNDKFVPTNLLTALHKPVGAASSKEVQAFTNAPELQEIDSLLTQTGGRLSYSDMTALKSKFGDMMDPRYAKPVNKAQIGQITKALDDDIEGAVKSLGNKDVVRDWQYAKATYANAMQDYRQAFKKLLGTKDMPVRAERVYDILVGQAGIKSPADMEAFKKVWGELGKAKQGDLAATVLSHMGNKDPEKLGDLEGFSLSTFLNNYKNLSSDAKELMFRNTGNAALEKSFDDLILVAQKMGVWPALESTSKSGTFAGMVSQVAAPIAYAAAGDYATAAQALFMGLAGPAAAAQVLTRPAFVRQLAHAMDKVHAGLTGSTKALLGIASQAQNEGIELTPSQENSEGGNQLPKGGPAPHAQLQRPPGAVMSDESPDPVRPGAQYASNEPAQPQSALPQAMSGSQSPATGERENLQAADQEMRLTPQEKFLYEMHLKNLTGSGGVDNPNGTRSSLFQTTVESEGKVYNLPTVWDGKIHEENEAWDHWKGQIDKFPSYPTEEEAQARYDKMHEFMERDTKKYQGKSKPESALPQEPSNFLADADPAQQAQQAREVAAQRQRQAVQPAEGRQEGAFTDALFDAFIPGRAAVRSLTQGQYGQAAVEAGMSAAPYGGKALGAALQAAPMLTKAVAASTAALTSLFMDTSEGASKLSPEDQSRIRMMQEKSKQEQQNRAKDAELRKQEADQKAARDAEAAERAAKTEVDKQRALAEVEANNKREQARIEEEHKAAEQRAAEETIKANAAENKRMAERPFREKHPDADLGMFMGGIAAAAILPGATQAYRQWAFNTYLKDWEKLDAVATQALKTGTREEQQLAINRLTAAAGELAKREGKLEKYPWLTQLAAPTIAAEMSMLPAEIDIRQPYGTKAHESAVDYYTDPATYAGLGLVAGGGFGLGHYSREAAEGLLPKGKIPTGTAGTVKTFEERNTAEALAAETAAKKKAEAAAKRKATLEAKKKADAKAEKKEEEPRKAKVPRGGSKIYGLRDE